MRNASFYPPSQEQRVSALRAIAESEVSVSKTYDHSGVTITFNDAAANFSATVQNKRLSAPSLAAIKKQIDAALAIKFEPFKALDWSRTRMHPVMVTGITIERRSRSYGGSRKRFECEGASYWRAKETVALDTPANRKLISALHKRAKEVEAEKDRLDAEIDALEAKIPVVKAADYQSEKDAQ